MSIKNCWIPSCKRRAHVEYLGFGFRCFEGTFIIELILLSLDEFEFSCTLICMYRCRLHYILFERPFCLIIISFPQSLFCIGQMERTRQCLKIKHFEYNVLSLNLNYLMQFFSGTIDLYSHGCKPFWAKPKSNTN